MEKKQYSIAGNVFYMLKLTKEYELKALWMSVVDFVCRCISPVFSIFIPKIAVDMVLGNGNVTWLSFCLFWGWVVWSVLIQTGMQGTHYLYVNEVRGIGHRINLQGKTAVFHIGLSGTGKTDARWNDSSGKAQ